MYQKELQHKQNEVEQLQTDIMHIENSQYMEQDGRIDIKDIDHWYSASHIVYIRL